MDNRLVEVLTASLADASSSEAEPTSTAFNDTAVSQMSSLVVIIQLQIVEEHIE